MGQLRVAATCCIAGLALLVLFVPPAFSQPASAFTDVPGGHRYARAINELAQLGIVSGMGDGTFRPNDPVYRAQFAKMICGLLEIEVSEDQSFAPFVDLGADDPGDLYPHEFVGAAYLAGITRGKTATTFSPYTNITLPQVLTMVVRAADAYYPGLLPTAPSDWYGLWADADADHGANVRRADYADLLAFLPMAHSWTDILRPATRGEVSQILVNLRARLQDGTISLSFEGQKLDLASPIYADNNRYYVPLTEILEEIDVPHTTSQGTLRFQASGVSMALIIATRTFTANNVNSHLKMPALEKNQQVYVTLIDLQKLLDLKVVWDEDAAMISLFRNRDSVQTATQPIQGRQALVRFEDVTSGQRYSTAESLAKLRVIFDYCYAQGIPMHLAWVPRYIDPGNGIDNAPAEDSSMHNANFVYTLDYFADRNGLIGLHGYTHQYGSQVSITGPEFDAIHNASESAVKERIRYALDDARQLDIPIAFWESPHYAALFYQQKIFGQYFDTLYEPKVYATEEFVSRITVGGRLIKFVPTPLGYIVGPGDVNNMIARIQDLGEGGLGSFFYHPSIEFPSIIVHKDEYGYPIIDYAADSPLHIVTKALIDRGFTFIDIRSL